MEKSLWESDYFCTFALGFKNHRFLSHPKIPVNLDASLERVLTQVRCCSRSTKFKFIWLLSLMVIDFCHDST